MAQSKRHRILAALLDRLREIVPSNGHDTDAGLRVTIGRKQLSADDVLPALTLVVGDPETQAHAEGDRFRQRLPFTAAGLVAVDPSDPFGSIEPLLADVKRAVFRADGYTVSGLAERLVYVAERVVDRPEGATTAAVEVHGAVEYIETYGDPGA